MYITTPDPEVYVIDMENQFVVSRHHRYHDEGNLDIHPTPSVTLTSAKDSEAVAQLLKHQKRMGTVDEWLPG